MAKTEKVTLCDSGIPNNSAIIPLSEYRKFLKYREAAEKNQIIFFAGGLYTNDSVIIVSTDEAIIALKEVINLQDEHIGKVEKELRDAKAELSKSSISKSIEYLAPGCEKSKEKLRIINAFKELFK